MYRITADCPEGEAGRLVVSASDLVGYLSCEHLTALSLEAASGARAQPRREDPELAVVTRRGEEHEAAYLQVLEAGGKVVARIGDRGSGPPGSEPSPPTTAELVAMEADTLDALRAGADAVYQATFFDHTAPGPAWRGHADFLVRVAAPSALGEYSYEPEDTKLARHVRPSALIQLCQYAEQLARIQGAEPAEVRVVLGGHERKTFRLADFAAYYRAAKSRFAGSLSSLPEGDATYPDPVSHCSVCSWLEVCEARREADDALCLVAGLRRDQARKLCEGAGIATVEALATSDGGAVPGIRDDTIARLARQARLQVLSRKAPHQPPAWELLDVREPGRGLARLPEADVGDIFFDIEGDPFVGEAGIEYLLGVAWVEEGRLVHRALWAHDAAEEKASFEELIDLIRDRLSRHPGMHVYHYASYEPAALGKLMGRYATREEELDELLRGEIFVDLYAVVRQSVAVGVTSYSLKKLEPLYMERRTGEIVDAASSIVEYERWLVTGDDSILDAICEYNRDDCESARLLREWLELRRTDLEVRTGEPLPRPEPVPSEPAEGLAADLEEVGQLTSALLIAAGDREEMAADRRSGSAQVGDGEEREAAAVEGATVESACRLLAHLLGWHRREAKPEWWRYFSRVRDATDDDLYSDTEAVAGLEYEGVAGKEKRSLVHRYSFDPDQEHKLSTGNGVVDPATARDQLSGGGKVPGPGTLVDVDPVAGELLLKRGRDSLAPHPRSLIPGGPLPSKAQEEALRRVARTVLGVGADGDGPYRAVRDLLLQRMPRLKGIEAGWALQRPGEDGSEAAVRLAMELHHGCLPIQGPPGSGKTYSAAAMVVALVDAGKRVGITANSHAAISHLLAGVMRRARDHGVAVRALQKADAEHACGEPGVECTDSNTDVESAVDEGRVDVVAGTSWLFARPGLDDQLDVLVVDEAGQLSLANTIAAGVAARSLVLVGDPRQLAQPSKGSHPPGAGISGLDQLLAGRATISRERGLFLDVTRRLSPGICDFVSEIAYEGRLHPAPGCERQSVSGEDGVGGSGIRWVPVHHHGNRVSSEEEAAVLADRFERLLGGAWTDQDGRDRVLGPDDLLVVAPYNAQVALLSSRLPPEARVGTVDKFQGQEAAVVLISLAASSADDVPRGMEFLYSRNRLNVAVSRARALAIVIGSPRLLSVQCRSVDQLRLANGLCRLVELAR